MSLIRFMGDMIAAVRHSIRERYYLIALNHCGHAHPDSWLLTRRALQSRMRVNDFLNRTISK